MRDYIMNVLALVTDAFGGQGGIAKFNRDMLKAVCAHSGTDQVMTLPYLIADTIDESELPSKLVYKTEASGSKLSYVWHNLSLIFKSSINPDIIICGHVSFLPIAWFLSKVFGAKLLLIIHGVDAWAPTNSTISNRLVNSVDHFVAVSEFTKSNFLTWTELRDEQGTVMPNCFDPDKFGSRTPNQKLVDKYDLHDKKVVMTLSRLSSDEQYKGHDEILEVMPSLLKEVPELIYMICGNGDDRERLENKAKKLGIRDKVIFTGYVPEEEKADHYRLTDVFAMPGRGEGFGIVYLEAMACGIPVVASSADASKEAVLNGELGEVVDPDDLDSIKEGIVKSLRKERNVPEKLDYFNFTNFSKRWNKLLMQLNRKSNKRWN